MNKKKKEKNWLVKTIYNTYIYNVISKEIENANNKIKKNCQMILIILFVNRCTQIQVK